MANNITIKDGLGANKVIAAQDDGGVLTPEHIVTELPLDPLGAMADAAIVGDNPGSISGKLRGLNLFLATKMPAALGQAVMADCLPVCFASDQSGLSIGALGASEAHIGQATKPFTVVSPTLAVTSGSGYTQGFCVGGVLNFVNVARIAAGTGRIISIILIDANQQNAEYTLLLFDGNPTHSTFTDGVTGILDPADFGVLLGSIDIPASAYISTGASISPITARSFAKISSDIPFVLPSGRSVYGVLLLKNNSLSPMYNSTSSLSMRMWIDQN